MRFSKIALTLSILLVVTSLFLFFTKGLNLGIDFTGGSMIEIKTPVKTELAPLRKAFKKSTLGEVSLQYFGDEREILIRLQNFSNMESKEVIVKAREIITTLVKNVEFRRVDYVGPTVGKELAISGATSLLIALFGILFYIWFRFEWQFGIGAIIALFHDAVLVVGFYIVTNYEFSLASIAAILTVIGYSINDSVVIYDRIRENLRKFKKKPIIDIINISLSETLSRTILTAGTTALAAVILAIWGGEVIRGFSLSLLFGVIIGTYSSIYIAAPIVSFFQLREEAV